MAGSGSDVEMGNQGNTTFAPADNPYTIPTSIEGVNNILLQLHAKIRALEAEAKANQSIVNEATSKLEAYDRSKIKLKAPAKYDSKKEDLARFLTEMASYMEHYRERFDSEHTKTRYVASRLEGAAARWFEPTLRDHVDHTTKNQRDFT